MSASRIEEIRARAGKADAAICEAAANARRFRMSIPPQPDDTDMLVTALCREDIPWLLEQLAASERREERLRAAAAHAADALSDWLPQSEAEMSHHPEWKALSDAREHLVGALARTFADAQPCKHDPYISQRGLPYCRVCGARLDSSALADAQPPAPSAGTEEK